MCINTLLNSHPELTQHCLITLLEKKFISSDNTDHQIHCMLSPLPHLLHQYCELKKEMIALEMKRLAVLEDGTHNDLGNIHNLYKISTKLNCDAYIYLSKSVTSELGLDSDYAKKLLSLLDLQKETLFIKSNSQRESGIKTYRGITKIKLIGEDQEVILQPYQDKFGNLLFVATNTVVHKALDTNLSRYAKPMIKKNELSIREIIETII